MANDETSAKPEPLDPSPQNQDAGPDLNLFETWVQKHYGENSRTKTITSEKYSRICQLIRGEELNTNAKFRFWVRSKGFRLINHDKETSEVKDDPEGSLVVSLHAKEENTPAVSGERSIESFLRTNLPAISFFRKVATVEEFYDIIKRAHVDGKGVHAGQKKTYRLVSDTYAFLPREVITFYLLNCSTCKPRIQKYGPTHTKAKVFNIPKVNGAPQLQRKDTGALIRPSPKRFLPYLGVGGFGGDVPGLLSRSISGTDAGIPDRQSAENKLFQLAQTAHAIAKSTEAAEAFREANKSKQQSGYPTYSVADILNRPVDRNSPQTPSFASLSNGSSIGKEFPALKDDLLNKVEAKIREELSSVEQSKRSIQQQQQNTVPPSLTDSYGQTTTTDEKRFPTYESRSIIPSPVDHGVCAGRCCSPHPVSGGLESGIDKIKDSFYGSRMQPYNLVQRHTDPIRNFIGQKSQSHLSKSKMSGSYSDIPYLLNKDMYKDLQARKERTEKLVMDFPLAASFWNKRYSSAESLQSWNFLRDRAVEKV